MSVTWARGTSPWSCIRCGVQTTRVVYITDWEQDGPYCWACYKAMCPLPDEDTSADANAHRGKSL